jgi:hypothetical protein
MTHFENQDPLLALLLHFPQPGIQDRVIESQSAAISTFCTFLSGAKSLGSPVVDETPEALEGRGIGASGQTEPDAQRI